MSRLSMNISTITPKSTICIIIMEILKEIIPMLISMNQLTMNTHTHPIFITGTSDRTAV